MQGKIIGGLIGLLLLGFIGAMLGVFLGHQYDQAVARGGGLGAGFGGAVNREALENAFFETTFRILGHIAKADGRVSEDEVAHTEQLMTRMNLDAEQRRRAIALFKEGAAQGFSVHTQMQALLSVAGRDLGRLRLFMEQLISIALADGELHDSEREALAQVAHMLGIPRRQFARLLDMLSAQAGFSGAGGDDVNSPSRLEAAYRALGVSADDSTATIKRAYRKLVSEHHPDRLMAKGLPDDVVKMATEKTQELHAAWETIEKARKA